MKSRSRSSFSNKRISSTGSSDSNGSSSSGSSRSNRSGSCSGGGSSTASIDSTSSKDAGSKDSCGNPPHTRATYDTIRPAADNSDPPSPAPFFFFWLDYGAEDHRQGHMCQGVGI